MSRSLVKDSPANFPHDLAEFLDDPPLVGDETIESYKSFLWANPRNMASSKDMSTVCRPTRCSQMIVNEWDS
jgi:hypothetical protein